MTDPSRLTIVRVDAEDFGISAATERAQLIDLATDFLYRRHEEATWHALRLGFLGGLEPDEIERFRGLPWPIPSAIAQRGEEWLVSEGVIELEQGPVAVHDLLLGPDGPDLPAEARAWIAALAGEPLKLYEVGACTPDGHLCFRNALHPGRPLRRVQQDVLLTDDLSRGEIVGARIVHWQGEDVVGGAIYPFKRKAVKFLGGIRREARDIEPGVCRVPAEGERMVELFVSQAMAWMWLQGIVRGES